MKKNMTKVMAMGMVLTMLAGTTAFASGTAAEATKGVLATAEDTKQAKAAFLGALWQGWIRRKSLNVRKKSVHLKFPFARMRTAVLFLWQSIL